EDGIRDGHVTGVQTCALPICSPAFAGGAGGEGGGAGLHPEKQTPATRKGTSERGTIGGPRMQEKATGVYRCSPAALEDAAGAAEIGRASCRERVEVAVVGGAW